MQQCPFESMGRSCGDLPGSDVAIFRDDRPYPDRVDESRLATLRERTTMKLKTEPARELDGREMLVSTAGPLDELQSRQLRVIDEALRRFVPRRLVSSSEAVDLLLDVRSALVFDSALAALLDELQKR
jgi:hypothetical protein